MEKTSHPVSPPEALAVVAFWRKAGRSKWFSRKPDFDAEFLRECLQEHLAAARREYDDWMRTPDGALALLILLDQFPRNAFRGTAHMYATDPLARIVTAFALDHNMDRVVDPALRGFMYLPLQHSENLHDQERSVVLAKALDRESLDYAVMHRDIIARFGRFPHRNRQLGRVATAEEEAFLDAGGFAG
jgi:uncharacterized protein (DUF924 family)